MKEKVRKFFNRLKVSCLNLIFPERIKCMFCESDVPNFEEKPICVECEKEIAFNNSNKCQICDEPIENEAIICDRCQKDKRYFKKAFCPFVYEGKIRSLILSYKDSNRRYLAKYFARFIALEISNCGVGIDVVTYVPLTNKKKKNRGFDQAKLLAEEISKCLNVRIVTLFEKVKNSKTQKSLSFKERQENMIGMYKLLPNKLENTQNILIVDDIITTGATINECSRLIAKKVSNVYVSAIARNRYKEKKQIK